MTHAEAFNQRRRAICPDRRHRARAIRTDDRSPAGFGQGICGHSTGRALTLRLCIPTVPAASSVAPTLDPDQLPHHICRRRQAARRRASNWYAPPAQIGDNLYFLGTRNHSTYALVSRAGEIILIDGNFDYATEDEIHTGPANPGPRPAERSATRSIAHAHGDHDGGAHLTEAAIPGVTIVYGEGDWPSVLARTGPHATRYGPQNDGTDGRVITVGDVSVKIVTMPGHTPGTLSFLFEFKDNGKPIRAAYPGGTAISFTGHGRLLRRIHRVGPEVRAGGSGLRRRLRCCRTTPSSTTPTSRRTRRWPFAPCATTRTQARPAWST